MLALVGNCGYELGAGRDREAGVVGEGEAAANGLLLKESDNGVEGAAGGEVDDEEGDLR